MGKIILRSGAYRHMSPNVSRLHDDGNLRNAMEAVKTSAESELTTGWSSGLSATHDRLGIAFLALLSTDSVGEKHGVLTFNLRWAEYDGLGRNAQ